MTTTETATSALVSTEAFLQHWQGHRRLTRRVIEAFPEDQLFHFSIGGMRTFGEMACEIFGMTLPTVEGVTTGDWSRFETPKPQTKSDLLRDWDSQTEQLNAKFPQIPLSSFSQLHKVFGEWEMPGLAVVQYAVDNEIHHRGEGYVYLRALGVEPPHFWER